VKKQPQENPEQLLRRFLRTLQDEGKVTEAKDKMFRTRKINKRTQKENVLRRLNLQAKRQKELRGY